MSDAPEAPGRKPPSTATRAAVLIVVVAAVAAAFYLKPGIPSAEPAPKPLGADVATEGPAAATTLDSAEDAANALDNDAASLPRIVEFGRGQCIACKMMKPVLEELARDFRGKLVVESIDVGAAPEIAREFNVRLIPLQVFIAPDGTELYRHEGFYSTEDILAKWKELGFDLSASRSVGG